MKYLSKAFPLDWCKYASARIPYPSTTLIFFSLLKPPGINEDSQVLGMMGFQVFKKSYMLAKNAQNNSIIK
jgi:hypothetical protein